MKIFPKFLIFGLFILSCTAINKSGALRIPEDAKDVRILNRAEFSQKSDPVNIKFAQQSGDYIVFDVSYSGGCAEHTFDLVTMGAFSATYPPEVEISLKHNNNGDGCRSVIDQKLYFNISQLKYDGTARVLLIIKNTDKTLEYNY